MKDTSLYQKIKKIIEILDPAKFRSYDERLNPEKTYPKPKKTWEVVHTVQIDEGNLTFRESTPLASIYVTGGYLLKVADKTKYYIELRPAGWDAIELVDPFSIKSEHADKSYEILVEGDLAVDLVKLVQEKLDEYNSRVKSEFEGIVRERLEYLKRHMQQTDGLWKKREDAQAMVYTAQIDDILFNICKEKSIYSEDYYIFAKRKDVAVKIADRGLSREMYDLVDKLSEVTGLLNLEKALDELRPKKDDDEWSD